MWFCGFCVSAGHVLGRDCLCSNVNSKQEDEVPSQLAFLGVEAERPVSSMEMMALEITIDSGAAEHVLSEESVPNVETKPSLGSRTKMNFLAANGDRIPNQGERS